MHRGFIKVHRKIQDWEWFHDAHMVKMFLYMLIRANHTEKEWGGIIIKPGEFVSSWDHLARDLNMSVKQVRGAAKKFESGQFLGRKRAGKYTVYRIENWELYQGSQENGAGKGQEKGRQRAGKGQQLKNVKNEKNENLPRARACENFTIEDLDMEKMNEIICKLEVRGASIFLDSNDKAFLLEEYISNYKASDGKTSGGSPITDIPSHFMKWIQKANMDAQQNRLKERSASRGVNKRVEDNINPEMMNDEELFDSLWKSGRHLVEGKEDALEYMKDASKNVGVLGRWERYESKFETLIRGNYDG